MKKLIYLFLFLFPLASCTQAQVKLNPADFAQKTQGNDVQLLDVRTPQEFAGGHVNQAKNINYYDQNFRTQVAGFNKEKPVYVYCQSGIRSAKAAAILKEMGFKSIFEMEGGFSAWLKQGLKAVK